MADIHGNVEGVRQSLLAQMKTLYDLELPRDQFAPPELLQVLAEYSAKLNREIAVYITRDGEIVDIIIGNLDSVPLTDYRLRRNSRRLSCVRCIHTHPGGTGALSDVDISALRSMRFDAMAAIGVRDGKAKDLGVGYLGEMVNGENKVRLMDPCPCQRVPQEHLMDLIMEADKEVLIGDEGILEEGPERAILVGMESQESLEELAQLADTAGAVVVGAVMQKRDKPDSATYIGSGKAQELSLQCQALNVNLVIFDEEISGIQERNLERLLGVKVVDRTTLILDIFAQRASSREGKLQVELAQLSYQATRLIGHGVTMSRLAGGIGTRGPGENKLEISRRRIRERVTEVRRELAVMEKQRGVRRKSREKQEIPVVALVGYTNAGKSTLLNRISGADVYVKDQLFATLDAVSRRVSLPNGGEFLLVDTVGFIRKLPHTLVNAFRSTLEEATLADVLIIVSDGVSSEMIAQHQVVSQVLDDLGATDQPRIEAMNKCDLGENTDILPGAIPVSGKDGTGLDQLLLAIERELRKTHQPVTLMIPFSNYGLLAEARPLGKVIAEEHLDDGTKLTILLKESDKNRLLSKYGPKIFIFQE